jgi:hypothetical protein
MEYNTQKQWVCGLLGVLISLWLYKENIRLRDCVYTLHIHPSKSKAIPVTGRGGL